MVVLIGNLWSKVSRVTVLADCTILRNEISRKVAGFLIRELRETRWRVLRWWMYLVVVNGSNDYKLRR